MIAYTKDNSCITVAKFDNKLLVLPRIYNASSDNEYNKLEYLNENNYDIFPDANTIEVNDYTIIEPTKIHGIAKISTSVHPAPQSTTLINIKTNNNKLNFSNLIAFILSITFTIALFFIIIKYKIPTSWIIFLSIIIFILIAQNILLGFYLVNKNDYNTVIV